jgi:hypothetical protein
VSILATTNPLSLCVCSETPSTPFVRAWWRPDAIVKERWQRGRKDMVWVRSPRADYRACAGITSERTCVHSSRWPAYKNTHTLCTVQHRRLRLRLAITPPPPSTTHTCLLVSRDKERQDCKFCFPSIPKHRWGPPRWTLIHAYLPCPAVPTRPNPRRLSSLSPNGGAHTHTCK